jgi:transcriptional regulator with XRE-family HTH domain
MLQDGVMRINGEALRVIRERTGLTITDLARASGVDRTVITRIENGSRRGTPAQHKALAQALDVSLLAIALTEQGDA